MWKTIDSVPRDGTEVLIWLGAPWSRIEKARWYEPWNNWQVGIVPTDPAREPYYGIGAAIPTYWQPLPDPPDSEAEVGKPALPERCAAGNHEMYLRSDSSTFCRRCGKEGEDATPSRPFPQAEK